MEAGNFDTQLTDDMGIKVENNSTAKMKLMKKLRFIFLLGITVTDICDLFELELYTKIALICSFEYFTGHPA